MSKACSFFKDLDQKSAFDKPKDGFPVFNSALQQKIILSVMESLPYDDKEGTEPLRLKDRAAGKYGDPLLDRKTFVREVFPLHHQRIRFKLTSEWAGAFFKPQPLPLIGEYFGEKYSLFFTFHGFYMSMLCIPASIGLCYSIARLLMADMTGSYLDNPLMPVMAIVISLWSCVFVKYWANLESAKRFDWDTMEFELEEAVQDLFKNSPKTVKSVLEDGTPNPDAQVNPVTGEIEDYYYDNGDWFPIPTFRARSQLVTFTVIAIINTFNILVTLCIWKFIARPIMGDGSNTSMVFVGGAVMGALSGILSFTIDCVMDGVPAFDFQGLMVKLIEDENWRTETEDEDANIMKTFFFKVVEKYFPLAYVAFMVNHVEVFGGVDYCPKWNCLPVVWAMFPALVITEICLNTAFTHGIPVKLHETRS
mmetsp:Transcript_4555/g.13762  ORF Transcript_4555/g.13762 Transcript_4555/m.13762 type:complete len:421 (+) Transcript_4555:496-1758(+)